MNTKTEKPKFLAQKPKNRSKNSQTAKPKIPMHPLLREGDFKVALSRKDAKNIFIY